MTVFYIGGLFVCNSTSVVYLYAMLVAFTTTHVCVSTCARCISLCPPPSDPLPSMKSFKLFARKTIGFVTPRQTRNNV